MWRIRPLLDSAQHRLYDSRGRPAAVPFSAGDRSSAARSSPLGSARYRMASETKIVLPATTQELVLPPEYRRKILALRRERNWDGEGADPISAEACQAAVEFVEQLQSRQPGLKLPRPAPSVSGAVSLYWGQKEEGLLVDIASADPAQVAFHWEGANGCYEEGVAHRDAVLDRVLTFCRQSW